MSIFVLQFRLRTILIVVTLCSFALGFWRYWESTRELHETLKAIRDSSRNEQERKLLSSLVWHDESACRRIGLHLKLHGRHFVLINQRVAWQSVFHCADGHIRRVAVLTDSLHGYPTTILVVDDRYRPTAICEVNCGGVFNSASVSDGAETPQLLVVTDAVGLTKPDELRGEYRYQLVRDEITEASFAWDYEYARRIRNGTEARLNVLKEEIAAARQEIAIAQGRD